MNAEKRRNRPGCKREQLHKWTPHSSLSSIDSVFATLEYVQQLSRDKSLTVEESVTIPKENENTDNEGWILEQFRQMVIELQGLVNKLGEVCNAKTHSKMIITVEQIKKGGGKAPKDGEDIQVICTAFKPAAPVPAIDYMLHTINQTTTMLSDQQLFPNRIALSEKAKEELGTWARRLYRIFAFGYFTYPKQFLAFEKQSRLCQRFTLFCKNYDMLKKRDILIPSKAFKKL